MPDELIKYLNDEKNSLTCNENMTVVPSASVKKVFVRELPLETTPFVGNLDLVVFPVKGDGACIYGSASAHIYHNEEHMLNL